MDNPIATVPKVPTVPKKTFSRRKFIFQAILIIFIFAFGILTYFAKNYDYFKFDLPITLAIQRLDLPWFHNLMVFMSRTGNEYWGSISILTIATLITFRSSLKDGFMLLLSSSGVVTLSIFLKTLVNRPRPDADLINQIGFFAKSDSFPSGHVLHAMGLYGFLLFLVNTRLKRSIYRNILEVSLITMIILMGISRIYLGAHWFSDTLGSYLIGTVWLYLMIFIYNKIHKPANTTSA